MENLNKELPNDEQINSIIDFTLNKEAKNQPDKHQKITNEEK